MKCIRALVMGGDINVIAWLNRHPLIIADSEYPNMLEEYDMIVFTGGADIHPKYYGQEPVHCNSFDNVRDTLEFSMMYNTKDTHYHFGICRGMQLLSVFNGDKLYQDITGHELHHHHHMVGKRNNYYRDKKIIGATSSHHQAVHCESVENIAAVTDLGSCVRAKTQIDEVKVREVVEAVWYPNTISFGVQGHPEYGHASQEFREYCYYHLVEDDDTSVFANLDI